MRIARRLLKTRDESDSLSVAALNYRIPLFHPDFPAIIMWSQKSACTIAVKWFFYHLGLLDEALEHHRWIHNYENDVFKARPRYLEDCRDAIRAGMPVIKLVRNPYERAFSGYLETCNRRVVTNDDHWSTQVRMSVLEYLTGDRQDMEYAYSFLQFCEWLAQQDASGLDPHISPQYQALERSINLTALRIDDTGNAFLRIEEMFALPSTAKVKGLHNSPHHHSKVQKNDAEILRLMRLGVPIHKDRAFKVFDATASAIAQSDAAESLRTLYRHDFDAYGYPV
ncbi:sulfotransferase family 2 domain-containing protein [Henriciella sp. AS95]|uniref:sulfotransferase family 2 domain-containing protein n=1 Tax=Henriciella sp. AS95 TaxID=3135782 RepID=UPI00316DF9E1